MAVTDAQRRAADKYRRANVRQISVRFYPDTMELYEWAKAHDNVQAYVRGLIRADMEGAKTCHAMADDGTR